LRSCKLRSPSHCKVVWSAYSFAACSTAETISGSVVFLLQPETVIRWHRSGFSLYWRWKSRSRSPGRPTIEAEIRDLILEMHRANPTWGAPRIHGEPRKLGFTVALSTVSKYLPRLSVPAGSEPRSLPRRRFDRRLLTLKR